MADYDIYGSDEDSGGGIDHIPKTPGPVVVEHDSDLEEDDDDEEEDDDKSHRKEDSVSEKGDESEAEAEGGGDGGRRRSVVEEEKADSEVERSDDEAETSDVEQEKKPVADAQDEEESKSEAEGDEESDQPESDGDERVVEKRKAVENSDESDHEVRTKRSKISPENEVEEEEEEEEKDSSDDEDQKVKKSPLKEVDDEDEDEEEGKPKKMEEEEEEEEDEVAEEKKRAAAALAKTTEDIFGDMSSEDEGHRKEASDMSDGGVKGEDDEDERKEEGEGEREGEDEDEDEEKAPRLQYLVDEEEDKEEPVPEVKIEVEIPRIVPNLGNEIHFVKLPNFLSVDTHPYDPAWYEDEIDEDEVLDEEGRARLKLKVENTVRWRNTCDENGVMTKESNSRIVKWSDGSMSLHLGSEIFDVHKQQLMPGDINHLFIRQGTGLQGQAVFKTKLTFRPHSTDSFTHRKMTLSLADRSQKYQKIRVLPNVGKDPEAHRSEMIKKEEDRLKASIRKENKMRRTRERAHVRGPTTSYLEPDHYEDEDEDGAISLGAIKNSYKKGGRSSYTARDVYTDSEGSEDKDDDSDLEIKKHGSEKKKAVKIEDSDED